MKHISLLENFGEKKEWEYLLTEPFLSRQYMTSHWIYGKMNILEIGGYQNSIDAYLSHSPESVTMIDPRSEDTEYKVGECRVKHIAGKFPMEGLTPDKFDCVVFLGQDIPDESAWMPLAEFYKAVGFVVVEYPPTWERSVKLFDFIIEKTGLKQGTIVDLDLSNNKLDLSDNSWKPSYQRRMVKLVS